MNKLSEANQKAKESVRADIQKVYSQISAATDRVPQKVLSGSLQTAKLWKSKAEKWRAAAKKGPAQSLSLPKLKILLDDATKALQDLSA